MKERLIDSIAGTIHILIIIIFLLLSIISIGLIPLANWIITGRTLLVEEYGGDYSNATYIKRYIRKKLIILMRSKHEDC